MGNAPSTCNNRYDGTITAFLVTYPGGTLDPVAHPNGTFTLYDDTTYNVTLTIHTPAQSSNGNSLGGTTWYSENLFGYYFGVCYQSQSATSIGPNQDVSITMNGITHPCCSGYALYRITFSTLTQPQQPVVFKIDWQPPPSAPAVSSTTSIATTSTSAISTTAPAAATPGPSSPNVTNTPTTTSSSQATASTPSLAYTASPTSNGLDAASSHASTSGNNPPSAPSLTSVDILAMTGLAIAGAYAVGWAMIRRLR
jgi:hypothetical protein